MKCQSLFSQKNKKNISKCCLLNFLCSMLSVNTVIFEPRDRKTFIMSHVTGKGPDKTTYNCSLARALTLLFKLWYGQKLLMWTENTLIKTGVCMLVWIFIRGLLPLPQTIFVYRQIRSRASAYPKPVDWKITPLDLSTDQYAPDKMPWTFQLS